MKVIIENLPPLPSALRYYDDFNEQYHSIRDLEENNLWYIIDDGEVKKLNFHVFSDNYIFLMKHIIVIFFYRNDTSSVIIRFDRIRKSINTFGFTVIDCFVGLEPHEVRQIWMTDLLPTVSVDVASALRAVLHSLCELNVGSWNPGLAHYVSQLPSPKTDRYKSVRSGDAFIPVDHQALVIDYFDELTVQIATSPERIDSNELRDACVLLTVYQYAFRPGQVARIKATDIRIFNTGAVHFSISLTKKWDVKKRQRVVRRIKRDWCPIFIEYHRRRTRGEISLHRNVQADSFFGLTPNGVGACIKSLMSRTTGEDWSANDLRHSAAQRLADAGAAHNVLSEFMGHSDSKTATVYYDASSSQAQRINQALGLSPIYSNVAEVARTRIIDKEALLNLPADKQIGAAPHGIPIAGIGACSAGQSLCIKNPVLSCYTCRKFMPVNDPEIHHEVTDGLRPVVLKFADASRGNQESPAYTQLRQTIESAQRVIDDIEKLKKGV